MDRTKTKICASLMSVAVLALVVAATTPTPLPSLPFSAFEYNAILNSSMMNEASIDGNRVLLGMTVQVGIEDCRLGTRWSADIHAEWRSFITMTILPEYCVVFLQPVNSSVSPTVTYMNSIARSLRLYQATSSPGDSVLSSVSIRVGWSYWLDQEYVFSAANTQHMYYCLNSKPTVPGGGVNVNYGSAVTLCQQWLQNPADPTALGATLVSLVTPRIEALLIRVRRIVSSPYSDPITGVLIGYVNLIGLFGTNTKWDNGVSISGYTNFVAGNPVGNFPTVLDADGSWKSVLSSEAFPYCCESTADGSLQEVANGFATLSVSASSVAEATQSASLFKDVSRASVASYFDVFYPFEAIGLPAPTVGNVFGFSASIHREDCDGSLRFSQVSSSVGGMYFSYDDDLCSIKLLIDATNSTLVAHGVSPAMMLPMIQRIGVLDIRGSQSLEAASGNVTKRFVWGFLLGDATPWTVNFSPNPHYYVCKYGSANFYDADTLCAALGSNMNEAYLATPQFQWEQSLLAALSDRSGIPSDDIWIGIDEMISMDGFANGDNFAGFSGWASGEPSLSYSPAAMSHVDYAWVSASRTSMHSYCCEMNSVPSRRASGVVYVNLFVLSASPSEISKKFPTTSTAIQNHAKFRPFAALANKLRDQSIRSTSALGVTMQVNPEYCNVDRGPVVNGMKQLPFLNVSLQSLPAGYVFCPSSSPQCPQNSEALRLSNCNWYLTRSDSQSVAVDDWLKVMELVELRAARFPINPYATNPLIGGVGDTLSLTWVMWVLSPSQSAFLSWSYTTMTFDAKNGEQFLCPSAFGSSSLPPWPFASFLDSISLCRQWYEDAYLAGVSNEYQAKLLLMARNLTLLSGSTPVSTDASGQAVWIGLYRNESRWTNGDPVTFTNWDISSGQPTLVGPTVLLPSGVWQNVPSRASSSTFTTAPFCCKRNGWNLLSSVYAGSLQVLAATLSDTVSVTVTRSASPSRSKVTVTLTATLRQTPSTTRSMITPSASHELTNSVLLSLTSTRTRPLTTSAQLTTIPPTVSYTQTFSAQNFNRQGITISLTISTSHTRVTAPLTPTRHTAQITETYSLSSTRPLPPIARIEWDAPSSVSFSASDIRSDDPSRRTIVVDTVFTEFVTSIPQDPNATISAAFIYGSLGQYYNTFVKVDLSPTSPSASVPSNRDFLHVGGGAAFVTASSFAVVNVSDALSVTTRKLRITLSAIPGYFPRTREVLLLSFRRNVTTMPAEQPPRTFPDLSFTITPDVSLSSDASEQRIRSTALAFVAFASPSALRDSQFMYLIGSRGDSVCVRSIALAVSSEGLRVVSPAHWDSTQTWSLWVGSIAIPCGWLALHIVIVFFVSQIPYKPSEAPKPELRHGTSPSSPKSMRDIIADAERETEEKSRNIVSIVPSVARRTLFPSLTVLWFRMFMLSMVSYSIRMVLISRKYSDQGNALDFDVRSSDFVVGVVSLVLLALVTIAVVVCAVVIPSRYLPVFVQFTEDETRDISRVVRWIAPRGRWLDPISREVESLQLDVMEHPEDVDKKQGLAAALSARKSPWEWYFLFGEYRSHLQCVVDWLLPWLLGWLVTYEPQQETACTAAYSAVGAVLMCAALWAVIMQPYASQLNGAVAAIAFASLASMMFCSIAQMSSPDGPSKNAFEAFRWIVVACGLARAMITIIGAQLVSTIVASGNLYRKKSNALLYLRNSSVSPRRGNSSFLRQPSLQQLARNTESAENFFQELEFYRRDLLQEDEFYDPNAGLTKGGEELSFLSPVTKGYSPQAQSEWPQKSRARGGGLLSMRRFSSRAEPNEQPPPLDDDDRYVSRMHRRFLPPYENFDDEELAPTGLPPPTASRRQPVEQGHNRNGQSPQYDPRSSRRLSRDLESFVDDPFEASRNNSRMLHVSNSARFARVKEQVSIPMFESESDDSEEIKSDTRRQPPRDTMGSLFSSPPPQRRPQHNDKATGSPPLTVTRREDSKQVREGTNNGSGRVAYRGISTKLSSLLEL